METQIIAITALAMSIGIVLFMQAKANREHLLQEKYQLKVDEDPKRWERSSSDPKVIEYYEQVAKEEYPQPEPFTVPEDMNTKGHPYTYEEWRFLLPEAVLKELHHAFGVDSEAAYRMKRAIELSIEHLMEEIADDAECVRIIEERTRVGAQTKPFDFPSYAQKRNRTSIPKEDEDHGNV